MFLFRVLMIALLAGTTAFAQDVPSPVGHWAGTLQVPDKPVSFELDLVKNGDGTLSGTIAFPAEHIAGLPLAAVSQDGTTIRFHARDDQPFAGTIADDGRSISGKIDIEQYHIPVTLTRAGDARVAAPPVIKAVPKELEGEWAAVVEGAGRSVHLFLTIANRSNGTAAAALRNAEEGQLTVPVSAITQNGPNVTFDLSIVGASFTAMLNGDASELSGTYSQNGQTLPLTFRRGVGRQ
jgi:hypothetical protein